MRKAAMNVQGQVCVDTFFFSLKEILSSGMVGSFNRFYLQFSNEKIEAQVVTHRTMYF